MGSYNGFSALEIKAAFLWWLRECAKGRRTPPTECMACGQDEGIIEPHTEDYSKPFGAHIGRFGLCLRCRWFTLSRFKHPDEWQDYCAMIRFGYRFEPLRRRNFREFIRHVYSNGTRVACTRHRRPTRFILEELGAGLFDPRRAGMMAGG